MRYINALLLIVILILNSFCVSYAQYNHNPLELGNEEFLEIYEEEYSTAIHILTKYNIVYNPHDKWSSESYITRRDAFEMAYIVYRFGSRQLCGKSELENYEKILQDDKALLCEDVQIGTYDNALVYALLSNTSLFYGKTNNNNERFAEFNEYITYNEAFAIITRLFVREWRYSEKIKQTLSKDNYSYYNLMKDMRLINSNSIVSYSSLNVDKERIDEKIPAFDFMLLICNALYTPHLSSSCYGNRNGGFRYIDEISKEYQIDNDSKNPYIYYIND